MLNAVKNSVRRYLRTTEQYTGTDNVALVRNGFWGVFSPVVGALVSLGLTVLYANLLPKETLGTFKYILALGGSLGFLTLTGMNNAVTQAVGKGAKGALLYSVRLQLRWNSLYAVASVILGGYYLFQHNLTIGLGIIILGIMFPVSAALNTYGAFLAGQRKFRAVALLAALSNVFYGITIALAIFFSKAAFIIVVAHALGTLIPIVIAYLVISKRDQSVLPPLEQHALKRFGQHLSLINIFATISKNIDRIALFHFAGPVVLATYSIANAVPERAKGLLASALPSLLPSLSRRDVGMIKSSLYMRIVQGLIIGIIAASAYWLLAPPLFHFVAPKYLESIQYSRWLSLGLILAIPYLYVANALIGQKMIRGLYAQSWTMHITRIITIPLAVYFYGMWGLVIGMLALQIFGLITYVVAWEIESRRFLDMHP